MPRSFRGAIASVSMQVLAAVLALVVLSACGPAEQQVAEPPLREPEYDGLSREQIEEQASPMTPEEAERLGIIDSSIHIEPPINPDSFILEGALPE